MKVTSQFKDRASWLEFMEPLVKQLTAKLRTKQLTLEEANELKREIESEIDFVTGP